MGSGGRDTTGNASGALTGSPDCAMCFRPIFEGRPGMVSRERWPRMALQQFQKRVFALSSHGIVDVGRIQRGFSVVGGEVASPNDGNAGKAMRVARDSFPPR